MRAAAALAVALATLWACARSEPAPGDPGASWSEAERALILSLSPLPPPPPSPTNPFADDPRAAALGHRLFFDPALSRSGAVSCATCHDPARAFTDGRPRAVGEGHHPRNTPTLLGAPWLPFLTADGARDSLWAQALGPLEGAAEHGLDRRRVLEVVQARHRLAWEAAFGPWPALDEPAAVDGAFVRVGQALEAYQRRLTLAPAPFDRFVAAVRAGDPTGGGHLDPAARRGLRAFLGEGRCVTCHHGPWLTDGAFHNLGLPAVLGLPTADPGRAAGVHAVLADPFRCGGPHAASAACDELRYLATDLPELLGAFKTPTLRNVADTAPYMHTGQLATLEDVVHFYRTLPGPPSVGRRSPLLAPLPRGVRASDLLALLSALSSPPIDDPWARPPHGTAPASTP